MASVAPANDLEAGTKAPEKSASQETTVEKEDFNPLYYYVYAFSMFVMVVGVLSYFLPSLTGGGWLSYITGALLLVVGVYLPLQADLIVTYYRLTKETGRFKQNNRRFKAGLRRQEAEIRKLKKAEEAFKKLDEQFGGNLDKAFEELEELQASANDRILQSSTSILSMYVTNKDRIIAKGPKMKEGIDILTSLYCRIFPQFFERIAAMLKAVEASDRFDREGGLAPARMSSVFQKALTADKVEDIPELVKAVMAEKGRATLEKEWLDGGDF